MLLGFGMESLFGMIRQLTVFLLIGMIEVNYPAQLRYFYQNIVQLLALDFLQGPYWYEKVFSFMETSAFSENFDDFDMGDMNFFMLSGSVPLLVCLIVIFGLVWNLIFRLSKRFYTNPRFRKLGMVA